MTHRVNCPNASARTPNAAIRSPSSRAQAFWGVVFAYQSLQTGMIIPEATLLTASMPKKTTSTADLPHRAGISSR